jgi:hypothetical protein
MAGKRAGRQVAAKRALARRGRGRRGICAWVSPSGLGRGRRMDRPLLIGQFLQNSRGIYL